MGNFIWLELFELTFRCISSIIVPVSRPRGCLAYTRHNRCEIRTSEGDSMIIVLWILASIALTMSSMHFAVAYGVGGEWMMLWSAAFSLMAAVLCAFNAGRQSALKK